MEKETRKLQPIKWHQGAFHKRSSICEASGQDKFHFVPSPCAFKSPSNLQCEKKGPKRRFQTLPAFPLLQQKESLDLISKSRKLLPFSIQLFLVPGFAGSRGGAEILEWDPPAPETKYGSPWSLLTGLTHPWFLGPRGSVCTQRGVRMMRVVSVCTALLKQRALAKKHTWLMLWLVFAAQHSPYIICAVSPALYWD